VSPLLEDVYVDRASTNCGGGAVVAQALITPTSARVVTIMV